MSRCLSTTFKFNIFFYLLPFVILQNERQLEIKTQERTFPLYFRYCGLQNWKTFNLTTIYNKKIIS